MVFLKKVYLCLHDYIKGDIMIIQEQYPQEKFLVWYNTIFKKSELYIKMEFEVEDSPWHREANVAIHTDMVVDKYLKTFSPGIWEHYDMLGVLACVFHDVGKPLAMEIIYKGGRGSYKRFAGHELISTRLWEDYAVSHWKELCEYGIVKSIYDIYAVGVMIEKHLPYSIKDQRKLKNLAYTLNATGCFEAYVNFLKSDQTGRISDNADDKAYALNMWVWNFRNKYGSMFHEHNSDNSRPILWIPVAASASGKSSLYKNTFSDKSVHFSLDDMRMRLYAPRGWKDYGGTYSDDYREAFDASRIDKDFMKKCLEHYMTLVRQGKSIYLDNTNTNTKARNVFLNPVDKYGHKKIAILFPISLEILYRNQENRNDKVIDKYVSYRHYMKISYPQYGEVDEVIVMPSYLP